MNPVIQAAHKQVLAFEHAQAKVMNMMLYGMKSGREGKPVDMQEAMKFHIEVTREKNSKLNIEPHDLRQYLQNIGLQEASIKDEQYKRIVEAGRQIGAISASNSKGANIESTRLVTAISSKLGKTFSSLVAGFAKGESLSQSVRRVLGEKEVNLAKDLSGKIEVDTKFRVSNVDQAMKNFLERNNIDLGKADAKAELPQSLANNKSQSQTR